MGDLLIIVVNNGSDKESKFIAERVQKRFSALSSEDQEASGFHKVCTATTIGTITRAIWDAEGSITVLFLPGSFDHQREIISRIDPKRTRVILLTDDPGCPRDRPDIIFYGGPLSEVPLYLIKRKQGS